MFSAQTLLGLSLVLPGLALAKDISDYPRPADPFADPANDPYNPLRYIASNVLTGIAFGRLAISSLTHKLMRL